MREIDKIAENLFDKIRSRFSNVNLGDETAKRTQDPERARFFNFDFDVDGDVLGNVTISLIDEKAMKVYFGSDIIDHIKQDEEDMSVTIEEKQNAAISKSSIEAFAQNPELINQANKNAEKSRSERLAALKNASENDNINKCKPE